MSFLFPQFLYGLLALSIPVIIHLFNFRRTKRIYFSSNQFLKQIKDAYSSKLKIKHLLILAARLLMILFLVMVFAQPVLINDSTSNPGSHIVLYLDNSWSMSNEIDEGITGLDHGIEIINDILNLYPGSTQYLLVTNDLAPFSNTFKTKEEIEDLITEIKNSSNSREISSIQSRFKTQIEQMGIENYEIYWITDFQKSTSNLINLLKNDTIHNNYLIPIVYNATANIFIDSVLIDNPFVTSNQRSVLSVTIQNQNEIPIKDLLLRLYLDNVQSATASISLLPNSSGTTEFDLGFVLTKTMKGRISFEEYPVTFDNDFYFTINPVPKINIIELTSKNGATPIEKVYAKEEIFNFTSSDLSNLNYNLLNNADLVIINEIQEIDESLKLAMLNLIEKSKNLVIFPHNNINMESYQSLIRSRILSYPDTTIKRNLRIPDFNNPFFANVFESKTNNFIMPEATSVVEWGVDTDAILKYTDGDPFLSGFAGSGTIYLFASPLVNEMTNFHRHAIFVPIMYKIAASSLKEQSDLYYTTTDPNVNFKSKIISAEKIISLKKEEFEIIPAQRISGNIIYLDIPKFSLETGFYDIEYDREIIGSLSFNYDKSESRLAQYLPTELDDLFSSSQNIRVFDAGSKSVLMAEIKEKYMGVPLWKYALILALIFLLAEIILIRFL